MATLANTIRAIKKQPTASDITVSMHTHGLTIKVPATYRAIFEKAYVNAEGFRIMQQDNFVLFSIYQLDLNEANWLDICCNNNIDVISFKL